MNKQEKATTNKTKQAKTEVKAKGKAYIVIQLVVKGQARKDILDKLVEMDPKISRKSNAGLVSHLFTKHNLIGKVDSGVQRAVKKAVTVKAKSKKEPKESKLHIEA